MFNILDQSTFLIIVFLITSIVLYQIFSELISKLLKALKVKKIGNQLFISKSLLILISLGFIILFKLDIVDLLTLNKLSTGIIFIIIGFFTAILLSLLSFQSVKNTNHGKKYCEIVEKSPLLVFLTLILLVGPAEDLLFIGILQNVLMKSIYWFSIPIYLIVFTLFHYINVLKGAESKKEFYAMIPVRLTISFILSLSFYLTHTLIYGFIIHNLLDTLSFLAVYLASKYKKSN